MARISGTSIPKEKRIVISLTYIYGIGPALSRKILKEAKVEESKRTSALTDEETKRIRELVEKKHRTEGELRRERRDAIDRLKRIDCYRGVRHKRGLPVRGQNTRTNNRTVRGNVRRVAGSGRKAPPSAK
jgi:small subunit ribosomal protein S13